VPNRHLATLLVLVVLVAASCGGGGGSEDAGATPGFTPKRAKVDNSPFEMANPTTTAGPTTIPGSGPTLPLPDMFRTTTTEAPTVGPDGIVQGAAPPTTEQLSPIASPGTSTPTCDAFYVAAQAGRDVQIRFANDPNADFRAAADRLVQAFNEAMNGLTPRLAAGPDPDTAVALRDRLIQMRGYAQQAQTLNDGGKVFYPLTTPQQPGERAGWPQILAHLNRYCPAVPRSFGVSS
jgi:hypothetical protein